MMVAVCNFFHKVRLLTPVSMMIKLKASPRRRVKRHQNRFIKASITGGSKIVRVALREAKN
jgi:hypothetical protein